MTKKLNRTFALAAAGVLCLLNTLPVQAATPQSEMEQLKQQVQQLMQQNQQLYQRLSEMEQKNSRPAAADPVPTEQEAARNKTVIEEEVARQLKDKGGQGINDFVTLSGSIEGDYKLGKDFSGAHTSEFVLDTVELILDVKATDWATGKIVVLYEGADNESEDLFIDEAHITLGKTEDFPFFLTGGKIFAPFGDFSTNMIHDPLTQTVGEINEEGAIAGFELKGLTGTVFAYNGIDQHDTDNDTINGYGASLAYGYEQDEVTLNAGIAWVNNIGSSGGISEALVSGSLSDEITGLSLNLGGSYGPFSLITEYTTALDSFDAAELSAGASGAQPGAWNSELAYTTSWLDKETVFALGYQKSWEAVALELPEHRYIASAAMNIFEGTTVTLEYYFDKDYSVGDGGTDENGYGFTTRVAYAF